MILLREVSFTKEWKTALADPASVPRALNLPMWALMTFAPTPSDDGWISVYASDDVVTRQHVAAALTFGRKSDGAINFLACPKEKIEAAGLGTRSSEGATFHPKVNARHMDIHVPDFSSVIKLAGVYIDSGEFALIEPRIVAATLELAARSDEIAFGAAAKASSSEFPRKRTWEFVGNEVVQVQGLLAS